MPAFRPSNAKQIVPSGDDEPLGNRRGERRTRQLINRKGEPRFDDLLTARFLEQTPTVSLPMNTAKKQARAVPLTIEPTVENPSPTHNMMADRILDFFEGGFNRNGQSWDQLLGMLLNDSIAIDTAPLEFVPTADPVEHPQTGEPTHWLKEVYFVDGSIVSKEVNGKGQVPEPPEPAFWKWGNVPNGSSRIFDRFKGSSIFDSFQLQRLQRSSRHQATPMTSDELAVMETNQQPPELSVYGRGIVQQVRPWAEILMNQDRANVRHFSDDEYAKGILNIGEQYAGEIDSFREYWKDEVEGKTDAKLPKIASENVDYIPFNESLKELQYLESQQWYSKLVWMLFGEATSTVGLAEDANRATAEAQDQSVFANTTVPRLRALEQFLNQHWLPKMREYWVADGELAVRFKVDEHPIMAEIEREKRRDDLDKGLTTPNEIREAEGKDPLPWGGVPDTARTAFEREHPEWVLENWGGVEDVPEPASDDGGLFGSATPSKDAGDDSDDGGVGGSVTDSETTGPASPDVYDDATTKDDGEFAGNILRLIAPDDADHVTESVVGIGVDFPNDRVYVDWRNEVFEDELDNSHVSIYGSVADLEQATNNTVEVIDTIDAVAADSVAEVVRSAVAGTADGTPDDAKPFGYDNEYDDFEECVSDNQDKDDPEAYCGWLQDETKRPTLRDALRDPDTHRVKDEALRNERADLPDLTSLVDDGAERLAGVLRQITEQLEPALAERWPDDPDERGTGPDVSKALAIDFDSILDSIDVSDDLAAEVADTVSAAMEEGADHDSARLVSELADELDDPDASIIAAFDVADTFAFERMRKKAAQDMVTVEDTVKEQVRTELVEAAEDNVGLQGATERLRERVDELSDDHARLVARTETLEASRHGSQALAESADAIGGKRWRSSGDPDDGRTRPWHAAMNDTVVGTDESFTVPSGWEGEPDYQPADYPRAAFVVGEDQPFNCRCVQQSVLAEDMPDDTAELRDADAVRVEFIDAHRGPDDAEIVVEYELSERQYEVREAHRDAAGESFADVWERVRDDRSKTAVESELGVSKPTVGKWDEQVGV